MTHRLMAWDGLPLCVLEWDAAVAGGALPLLCLPGLVRTAGDFATLAATIGAGRRVVAVDYPGRGRSGRCVDAARYRPEACLRDVMDICAALHLHLHRVVAIGTSFGGLLAMGLAAARPGLLGAVVLNDVGPEIGSAGAAFVRRFVGHDPALADLDACVAYLREVLPPLSLETDEEWREMAALTYAPGPDGRYHPLWDTRIAGLLGREKCGARLRAAVTRRRRHCERSEAIARPGGGSLRRCAPRNDTRPGARVEGFSSEDGAQGSAGEVDLWALFGAMAHLPLLLIRGELSDVLLADTVARMRRLRPDMEVVALPGIGHAPTLREAPAQAAMRRFLEAA